MGERILIVDDEQIFRTNIAKYLTHQGHDVTESASGEEALRLAREHDFAVVLTDIHMPGMGGQELLEHLSAERPDTAVILMTAYASMDTAIDGFRSGAFDYVLKPVALEDIRHKVENVLRHERLRRQVRRLHREIEQHLGFEGIIGQSPRMQRVFELIETVADLPTTVLITGESGTGKELVARALHERSRVSTRGFVAVNMGAINDELIEAQFFGAEKGAYTGADREREGIFRGVDGGTIFLDEIGELPSEMQTKLLRTVEQKEVLPVGASCPVEVDFRLVAATNRPLEDMVEEGTFRRDLFYRLNVFRIELPALRERREDIPLLVEHFAKIHARALGRPMPAFSNDVMKLLTSYEWLGNVRELSNVIERALILSRGERVERAHLPDDISETTREHTLGLKAAVARCERQHIRDVLRIVEGNREKAAELLEIDPATLYRRLSKYDIQ